MGIPLSGLDTHYRAPAEVVQNGKIQPYTTTSDSYSEVFTTECRFTNLKRLYVICFGNNLDIQIVGYVDPTDESFSFVIGETTLYAGIPHVLGIDFTCSHIKLNVKPTVAGQYGVLAGGYSAVTASSQTSSAIGYEAITVTSTTAIGFSRDLLLTCNEALITVEDNQIRFRLDRTDPTITEGHLLQSGDTMKITSTFDILNFKAIATGGDAKLRVTYSR